MEDGQTTFEVKIKWVRILIGGFLAEAVLILLVIPVSMKWGQQPLLYSIRGTGRIFGAVFPVWVLGGTRGEVEVHIARATRGRGCGGDLSSTYPSRAGALGLCRGTRAEVDRWSEWGMDGGARSAMTPERHSSIPTLTTTCTPC